MVEALPLHDLGQWVLLAGALLTFFRLWGTVKANATREVQMQFQIDQLRKDLDEHRANERDFVVKKLENIEHGQNELREQLAALRARFDERDRR